VMCKTCRVGGKKKGGRIGEEKKKTLPLGKRGKVPENQALLKTNVLHTKEQSGERCTKKGQREPVLGETRFWLYRKRGLSRRGGGKIPDESKRKRPALGARKF